MLRTAVIVLVVSVVSWAVIMGLFSALATRPTNLGPHDGKLASCPTSPNCVCSFDQDPGHAIAPLTFEDSPEAAWARLRAVLLQMPRTGIVTDEDGYLHVECTSLLFRFVDDLEFLLDADAKQIHVRSASRAGHSDLGVNRARVEAIRKAFTSSEGS
ncbi:MAG: DUF1499 domain-containing protein [Gemmataceae bacterium]